MEVHLKRLGEVGSVALVPWQVGIEDRTEAEKAVRRRMNIPDTDNGYSVIATTELDSAAMASIRLALGEVREMPMR